MWLRVACKGWGLPCGSMVGVVWLRVVACGCVWLSVSVSFLVTVGGELAGRCAAECVGHVRAGLGIVQDDLGWGWLPFQVVALCAPPKTPVLLARIPVFCSVPMVVLVHDDCRYNK